MLVLVAVVPRVSWLVARMMRLSLRARRDGAPPSAEDIEVEGVAERYVVKFCKGNWVSWGVLAVREVGDVDV